MHVLAALCALCVVAVTVDATALMPSAQQPPVHQIPHRIHRSNELLSTDAGKLTLATAIKEEKAEAEAKRAAHTAEHAAAAQHFATTITEVVVIGDLHGDLNTAKMLLKQASFIDAQGEFVPPPHRAVFLLGDYTDRGPQDLQLLDFLFAARKKYPNHLYMLMGNHESMLLLGDSRFSKTLPAPSYCKPTTTGRSMDLFSDVVQCSGGYNQRLRSLPAMLTVGNTLIAHGGPTLHWTEKLQQLAAKTPGTPLTKVYNDLVANDLRKVCEEVTQCSKGGVRYPYPDSIMSGAYEMECDDTSPLWARGLSTLDSDKGVYLHNCCSKIPRDTCANVPGCTTQLVLWCVPKVKQTVCEAVDKILAAFNVERMILAHSIKEQITALCGGKVILVDVGLSVAYRNGRNPLKHPRQYLELYNGKTPRRQLENLGGSLELAGTEDFTVKLGPISCLHTQPQLPQTTPSDWCTPSSTSTTQPMSVVG